jgi:hypothetical protein
MQATILLDSQRNARQDDQVKGLINHHAHHRYIGLT